LMHNFCLSVLTLLIPSLCETYPLVSFLLWVCGSGLGVIALELSPEEVMKPQALEEL
jgi:hypothetical protein